MRGLGAFQMAQMKQRDARVIALCQHLRSAIDILEQIASDPYRPPEKLSAERVEVAPAAPPSLSPERLAYTINEACTALGIGSTTLYKALAAGELVAIKLGSRTLIRAEALRQWMSSLPRARR